MHAATADRAAPKLWRGAVACGGGGTGAKACACAAGVSSLPVPAPHLGQGVCHAQARESEDVEGGGGGAGVSRSDRPQRGGVPAERLHRDGAVPGQHARRPASPPIDE